MMAELGRTHVLATWIVLVALLALANLFGNASPYIYLAVLVAAWPVLLLDGEVRRSMNRWESYAYLLAFLGLLIAFTFAAGGWEHFNNVGNFLPFLLFIPAIGLMNKSAGHGHTKVIAILALVGAIMSLGMALYDVSISGLPRAVGWVNTTNPFAVMCIMLGFLALMGFWAFSGWRRYVFFIGPVAGLYATVLAGTRSVLMIVMALAAIFIVFVAVRLAPRARIILAGAAIAGAGLAVAAIIVLGENVRAFRALESIYLFVAEGEAIDRSVAMRLELFRGGILAFLQEPIFGHGWRHHVEAARPFMIDTTIADDVAGWSHLHNDYINFAALAGVFGLLAYFIYLLVPIIATWRSIRDSQFHERLYGAFVMVACYAIYGMFGSAFAAEMLLCFGPVFTAVLLGYCKDDPDGQAQFLGRSEPAQDH
ncbi:O-antigen ligase family protein [Pelagibacterium luteolum]|uniref:O-antigen ligase n=1 Tax=Pelagibacterium luteolum TaxID=440168 RepID=A0A1G7XX27_9HYPH|nr:O-antigen ligase family protein [Pelagibacterium luteolum]SDG88586.1 O-antigen ligase [Pelagibacterium luteolum]